MCINDYNTIFTFFLAFKKIDRYKVGKGAAFITTAGLLVLQLLHLLNNWPIVEK